MGRYDRVRERTGWVPPAGETVQRRDAIAVLLTLSYDSDPLTRRVAAKNLCPCHLRANHASALERLIKLAHDADAGVRADSIHALADGSPSVLRARIVEVFEALYNDPDPRVRKQVRRVLTGHRRTGNVNVL